VSVQISVSNCEIREDLVQMDLVESVVSDDVVSHPGAETCSSLMLVINIMLLYLVSLVVDTLRASRRWFIIILIFATICNWRAGIAQSL
jgi:hypothetical protein